LFPFGYGLSYTDFVYSNVRTSANTFKDVDGLTVTIDVTNKGKLAGKEIVQVYVHDHESVLVRPEKELKGFSKVELQPGETQSVSIQLDSRAFAYYHPEYKQWITETGDFDILVAASAADIRHKLTVTMISTQQLPSLLDKESTIREWTADPCGNAVITPLLEKMVAMSRQAFGDDTGTEGIGMNIMDMFMDMPLLSVLMFQQSALSISADDIVDGMLMQVHSSK
jgi:beta-glucosidase